MECQVIKLMSHCIVFGSGSITSCFDSVSAVAPIFLQSFVDEFFNIDEVQWVTRLPNSNAAWTAIEGPAGSAIFTSFPCELDQIEQMIRDADMPIEQRIRKPWSHADVKPNEPYPAQFVEIFCSSRLVRSWDLPALAHLRPPSFAASPGSLGPPAAASGHFEPLLATTPPPPPSGTLAPQHTDILAKGANVSLSAQTPNLATVRVGLGWDARTTTGAAFDLDASALACGPDKQVVSDQHFVFYNNPRSPEGTIVHTGDNTTGDGAGDDEASKSTWQPPPTPSPTSSSSRPSTIRTPPA